MNESGWCSVFGAILLLGGLVSNAALAQEADAAGSSDQEDLAKAAQNPIASLISLPLQNNTNFGVGPEDATQNILNIQPVYPVRLSDDWNLITRTILPVISQPALSESQSRKNGIGDVNFTAFFSPADSGAWTWGVGPTVTLPTASDDRLGGDQWLAGASVVALTMPGNWVYGFLMSNSWSVGGSSTDADVSQFLLQPFLNYNIPDSGGWYLSSVPIITADWEASSSERWTIPIGGGAGKVFNIGKQPVNAQAQVFYNIEKPTNGADWQLRLQLQFLFPK